MFDESDYALPAALNPTTGRIDALRLAELLNLSVSEVAAMVSEPEAVVRADPSALTLQARLTQVAFVASGLRAATGWSLEQVMTWLAAPNPELDGHSSLHLMRHDKLDVIVDLVHDILTGEPA